MQLESDDDTANQYLSWGVVLSLIPSQSSNASSFDLNKRLHLDYESTKRSTLPV